MHPQGNSDCNPRDHNHSGTLGGWVGGLTLLVAIFVPAFLMVAGALPFWESLRQRDGVQRAKGRC